MRFKNISLGILLSACAFSAHAVKNPAFDLARKLAAGGTVETKEELATLTQLPPKILQQWNDSPNSIKLSKEMKAVAAEAFQKALGTSVAGGDDSNPLADPAPDTQAYNGGGTDNEPVAPPQDAPATGNAPANPDNPEEGADAQAATGDANRADPAPDTQAYNGGGTDNKPVAPPQDAPATGNAQANPAKDKDAPTDAGDANQDKPEQADDNDGESAEEVSGGEEA